MECNEIKVGDMLHAYKKSGDGYGYTGPFPAIALNQSDLVDGATGRTVVSCKIIGDSWEESRYCVLHETQGITERIELAKIPDSARWIVEQR